MTTNQIIDEWFENMKEHTKRKTYAMVDEKDIEQLKNQIQIKLKGG